MTYTYHISEWYRRRREACYRGEIVDRATAESHAGTELLAQMEAEAAAIGRSWRNTITDTDVTVRKQ